VFAILWKTIREEADALAHDAERLLLQRGAAESQALRTILQTQRSAIIAEIERRGGNTQLVMQFDKREAEQFRKEREHMDDRLASIQKEIAEEPKQIEAIYKVALRRLEPVGLVFLWPETRG
jgi:vacuolar-type H+-ATPase subunit I/STV1